jgi:hypothetical protein
LFFRRWARYFFMRADTARRAAAHIAARYLKFSCPAEAGHTIRLKPHQHTSQSR